MAGEIAVAVQSAPAPPTSSKTPTQTMENQKKNRIQVSNTKKPLFFYVNLAKVWLSHLDCC